MISIICETILIGIGTIVSMLAIIHCCYIVIKNSGYLEMPEVVVDERETDNMNARHEENFFTVKERKK